MSNLSQILLQFVLIMSIHWVKQFCQPKEATQAYAANLVLSLFLVFAVEKVSLFHTCIHAKILFRTA